MSYSYKSRKQKLYFSKSSFEPGLLLPPSLSATVLIAAHLLYERLTSACPCTAQAKENTWANQHKLQQPSTHRPTQTCPQSAWAVLMSTTPTLILGQLGSFCPKGYSCSSKNTVRDLKNGSFCRWHSCSYTGTTTVSPCHPSSVPTQLEHHRD